MSDKWYIIVEGLPCFHPLVLVGAIACGSCAPGLFRVLNNALRLVQRLTYLLR